MLIAQVTDTHIKPDGRLAYRRVDTASYLASCVDHLQRFVPQPDLVLFTGDLTDAARPEEYARFRSLIAPLQVPWYVIPGNHDDRTTFRQAFPELSRLGGHDTFIQYVIEDYPLRLIALDTTIPGAKEGVVCKERLAWLEARLAEAPLRPTLIFMHHPPFLTGIAHMDAQNCRNAAGLGAVVRRHRQVVRIICGHVHRAVQVQWNGVTASIAPSPAHSVALDLSADGPPAFVIEPPSCQFHYLTEERLLVSHLSYVGSFDGPHPFFTSDGRLID
jgi:3',5'-cyclic-AMP phosphodiesterase